MRSDRLERLHHFLGCHRGRIWLTFILLALLLSRAQYSAAVQRSLDLAGGALLLAGIVLRFYAEGHAGKRARAHTDRKAGLITTGPYAFMRNPKYLGNFLAGLGLAVMTSSPVVIGIFIMLFFVMYGLQVEFEERALAVKFGAEYERYRAQVPRWIPRLRIPRDVDLRPHATDFRYEWLSAAVGLLAAALLHYVKTLPRF